ncbi:MAG: heat-inducible transcription repressor HrcA [Fimbriimonadaceae bacterium]|nr:heat-inducible transcription repressor HrcA [Fimbriimonadaceae bacterium]
MSELSDRKKQILRAVVVEYVTGTEPVPSELIASKYELGVRSATVRNEMAEITDLGLLEQPHTSAGRVPSDVGYRYYVDRLVVQRTVNQEEGARIRGAATDEEPLRDLVQETAKALSRLTHLLSAALTVRNADVQTRSAVLTAIGPEKGLVILVLQNGHVENRLVDVPPGVTLEHIGGVNDALQVVASGVTLKQLDRSKTPSVGNPVVDRLLRVCHTALRAMAKDLTRGHLVTEGEEYIFAQPEFVRSPEAMASLVRSMEDEGALISALGAPIGGPSEVTIGREHMVEAMRPLSMVRQTFYVGETEAGTLAIIGPTRMDYDRNIALLDFTAQAVSQTLTRLMS